MKPWLLITLFSFGLIFMCLFHKRDRPLDFVLPICFITNHANCLRRIKRGWISAFIFQDRVMSWEEGWCCGWIMEYSRLWFCVCSLIVQNQQRPGADTKLPLFSGKWQREFVPWSFCPWTTKLQILGLIITRRQFRPSFKSLFTVPC